MEPSAHLTPPAPQSSEDVPQVHLSPRLDPNCPQWKRQMEETCPHSCVLVLPSGFGTDMSQWATGAPLPPWGPGLILCLFLGISPSLSGKHPSSQIKDMGAQGAPGRGPGRCCQNRRCCGTISVGLGRPLLSTVAVIRACSVQEGGKGRNKYGEPLLSWASHTYLGWRLISFTLHSKAEVAHVLIPIRQEKPGPERAPRWDSSGGIRGDRHHSCSGTARQGLQVPKVTPAH